MEGGSKQDLPKMKAMDVDKDSSAVTSIEMVCRKNVNNVDGKKGGWNCEPKWQKAFVPILTVVVGTGGCNRLIVRPTERG